MDLAWRPCDGRFDRLVQVTLRRLHRMMALGLAIFIVLHLMNHVMILFGPESHVAMMDMLRYTYRHPVVEFALFAAFYMQIFIGLRLLWRRGKPRRFRGNLNVVEPISQKGRADSFMPPSFTRFEGKKWHKKLLKFLLLQTNAIISNGQFI